MKKARMTILIFGLLTILFPVQSAETYAPPVLKMKEDRPVVKKIVKETVEDTKNFGQFEHQEKQERELASDKNTTRDPSSNSKSHFQKKNTLYPAPQKMPWKE